MKGKFVIFEGPDYCGKSTQIRELYPTIGTNTVLFTREPGSWLPQSKCFCEAIREKVLFEDHTVEQQAKLFATARKVHTAEIISLINKGYTVISDRYIVSSLAYQGYAQYLGKDAVYEYNKDTIKLLKDHDILIHCFKFNLTEEEWLNRRRGRFEEQAPDKLEQMTEMTERAYEFFNNPDIFKHYTDGLNMVVHEINANNTIEAQHIEILKILKSLIH